VAIPGFPSSRQPTIHTRLKKWQLALMALTIPIIALTLLAVFTIQTIEISARKVASPDEIEFTPVSAQLVHENKGLREAVSCAESRFEILKNSPGYSIPVDDVCYVKISWSDFEMIQDTIPLSQLTQRYDIVYDEKYYLITSR
jgi:hypothetical protein